MAADANEARPFLFLGNALWLDFVNTEIVADGTRADLLKSGGDVWAWLTQAGALNEGDGLSEADGERLLRRARELRAFLRNMAAQMAQGAPVSEGAVEAINDLLRLRRGRTQLFRDGDAWRKEFRAEDTGGDTALVPIAQSAADLLSEGDWRLIRRCEHPKCILYFYDTSKNHKRRWCSMAGCGNRVKAAHHRRSRHKEENMGGDVETILPLRQTPTE